MTLKPTLQERAYQLAAELGAIPSIRAQLMREHYEAVDAQLSAPTFRRELKRLCRAGAPQKAD
jgi:hypothetical protein